MSDLPERLRVVADERDEHACWREKLADDLHDRETQISDAWQALRDAGVQSEQSIADGIELMRRQLVEAETDAQRYRWLRGGADIPPHSSRWARWEVRYWCGRHWNTLFAEQIDAAIDALIAQADEALK